MRDEFLETGTTILVALKVRNNPSTHLPHVRRVCFIGYFLQPDSFPSVRSKTHTFGKLSASKHSQTRVGDWRLFYEQAVRQRSSCRSNVGTVCRAGVVHDLQRSMDRAVSKMEVLALFTNLKKKKEFANLNSPEKHILCQRTHVPKDYSGWNQRSI